MIAIFSRRVYFFVVTLVYLAALFGCNSTSMMTNPKDGKSMVLVSAGEFKMGTSPDQARQLQSKLNLMANAFDSESPQQILSLPTFYIDQTPVTNAEYKKFLDADTERALPHLDATFAASFNWDEHARTFPRGRDNYPVVMVTWQDAMAYCQWAGAHLPTEAEWEKAARGTDARVYPWGDEFDSAKANTAEKNIGDATPVGQFVTGASPYGALDMVGNVWQWTSSLAQAYPYNAGDGREDASASGLRVTRGGSWLFGSAIARTTLRNRFEADQGSLSIGFRCAK